MSGPRYSFVIPIYNEQQTLPALAERLNRVLDELDGPAEVIIVDDASTDDSFRLLGELHERDGRYKPVRLSRNFGHQIAISAGIDFASGEAVVIMDGDLQDPPELVPELVARWQEGYDVVYGVRTRREGDPRFKRMTAALFYRTLKRLTQTEVPLDVGDFRLVDHRAVEAFRQLPERNRYVRGMFSWVGFNQIGVPYERAERAAGEAKYSYRRSLKLALDGIISFSTLPLRLVLAWGFLISAVSFLVAIFAIGAKAGGLFAVPGWASIVLAVSFLGGVQLMLIGVVGLYVGRMYEEVKARPLYVVRDAVGFSGAAVEHGQREGNAVRPLHEA